LGRVGVAKKPRVYRSKHPPPLHVESDDDEDDEPETGGDGGLDENVNYEVAEVKMQPPELIIDDDYGSPFDEEQVRLLWLLSIVASMN
jgi:hypothetical protein